MVVRVIGHELVRRLLDPQAVDVHRRSGLQIFSYLLHKQHRVLEEELVDRIDDVLRAVANLFEDRRVRTVVAARHVKCEHAAANERRRGTYFLLLAIAIALLIRALIALSCFCSGRSTLLSCA